MSNLEEIRDRIDHLRKVDANAVDPGTYQVALLIVLNLLTNELERLNSEVERAYKLLAQKSNFP